MEGNVRPIIGRMKQAAFDVFFNKSSWHSADLKRRLGFNATGTSVGTSGPINIISGRDLRLEFQLTDIFGSYPLYLGGPPPLPSSWWTAKAGKSAVLKNI